MQDRPYRGPGYVIFDEEGYDLDLALESIGPGWHDIIRRVFQAKPDHVKVEQVKEKFGGLRIYYRPHDDVFDQIVSTAESDSYRTCDVCGAPGNQRGRSWITTRCDAHG